MEAVTKKKRKLLPDTCSFDLATTDDVVALTYLFKEFFEESNYRDKGITYSPARSCEWLRKVISSGVFPHVVAKVDDKIVGVVSWSMDHSFSEEPIAVLHTIYVTPPHRISAIGRTLVSLAMDIAREEGACAFSAPISSGIDASVSLANMLRKAGFKYSGAIMTKGF